MKLGVNTLIWTGSFEEEHLALLPAIKDHGFDVVEVARFEWGGCPAAAIRRTAESLGLGVIACSAFTGRDLSLVDEDAAVRARSRAFLDLAIERTAEMGAGILVGPYLSPVGYLPGRRRTEDEWKRAVEELRAVAQTCARFGVRLGLEALNRFESYTLNTAADAARLCDEVHDPHIGVLYDTFHAHIEEKDQGQALRTVGRHLIHVHSCENDRGIPGTGQVAWTKVFTALAEIGYQGCLTIESFGFRIPEIAAATCIWRDIAPTPESIAWQGAGFLRAQMA